jgi:hypothetical protein
MMYVGNYRRLEHFLFPLSKKMYVLLARWTLM